MSRHLTPNLGLPYYDEDDVPDGAAQQADLAQTLDTAVGSGGVAPVGAMFMWPAANAPVGYLLMQGQQVDAAAYPKLAALLGQVAGKVTIPDMRDTFAVGAGASALLSTGGAASVALTGAQSGMPAHNHGGLSGMADRSLVHWHGIGAAATAVTSPGGLFIRNVDSNQPWVTTTLSDAGAPDHMHSIAQEAARDAAQGHENRPPYRAVNFIIRAG